MTAYDVRARAQAARQLGLISAGGKGQAVTITTPGVTTYNPATGTNSTSSPTTQSGSGIELAYPAESVDGTLIQSGDMKFLLSALKTDGAALTKPVADSDTLTKADGTWAIKRVDALAPAGLAVMYTLQLRRT